MPDAVAQMRAGVLCMFGAHAGLIVSDSAIRWMTSSARVPVPLSEAMFFRGLVAIPGLLLIGLLVAASGGIRIRSPGAFVLRGSIMAGTNMAFFLGLGLLPYAHSLGLFFISPVLITVMSAFWLREPTGIREWGAVLIGAAGVAIMLDPFAEAWNWAGVFPLAAAAGYGSLQIMTRRTRLSAGPTEMALSAHLGILVTSAVLGALLGGGELAPRVGGEFGRLLLGAWVQPNWEHLWLALICGSAIALGGSLLFQSYRLSPGSTIAPLEYVHLPLAALSGYLIWHEVPDLQTLAGIALVVAGGLAVTYRGRRRRQS